MHSPLVFVPIETKVREFQGKLLFALMAAEQGFTCIIGDQRKLRRALPYLDRGLYLEKSLADTKKEWFGQCRAYGNRLASWDEEGLVFLNRDVYRGLRLCEENFSQLEGFFAWGENQAEAIRECKAVDGAKVHVTGNPRFDMLRPELRAFYDEPVEALRRQHGRIILMNTGFPLANHFQGMEIVRKQFLRYPVCRVPGFLEGWTETQRLGLEAFKKILPQVAAGYPDHTIILRPHPSENRDNWLTAAAGLRNVKVNAEGNVIEWILAAEVVLHSSCTTGVEAFYLNVPAVGWRNGGGDAFEQPLPNALSLQAFSVEEMMSQVQVATGKRDGNSMRKNPEAWRIAAEHITGMEGPLACDRILDVMKVLDCRRMRRPVLAKLDRWARDAAADLRKFVETRGREDFSYAEQKFPGLALQEVEDVRARFQKIMGRFGGIRISRVCDACFMLQGGGDSN